MSIKALQYILSSIAIATGYSLLSAGEWSGYVTAETRLFEHSPLLQEQEDGASAAIILEPEFYTEWEDGDRAFEITPYVRLDSHDSERDLFDLREMSYLIVSGDWEIRFGVSKVFWGVAESQHLVDTVNQTDFVASPDGEDKLGQPMIHVVRVTPLGDFELFLLPGFRERTFPGREGRLRSSLWVDTDRPLYESAAEESHVDGALRWFNIVGDFDIGLHYFRGTNREPLMLLGVDGNGNQVLRPFYEQMDQVGLDLQYTKEGWLLKFEGIARETTSTEFSAMVGGFEYTFYGLGGTAIDAGLLAEGHFDSRGSNAPTLFNRDLFIGTRLTWNDDADTALVAGGFVDLDSESVFARVEFERRIGSSYKLEFEVQKLTNIAPRDPLFGLRRDSYAQLSLSRYW